MKIKTLIQNALRDSEKLERLLKVKQRQKEEADQIEDIHMPKLPLYLDLFL